MRLYFFGTCAGTEPRPDRNHVSFAIETAGRLYWFDAGEGCSRTAHNMGLDLLAVRAVFLTHTHMDHVGGLANLFWNIRKLENVKKRSTVWGDIDLVIPCMETFDGIMQILRNTEGNFAADFTINPREPADGTVYDDGIVRVDAIHSNHLQHTEGEPWRAFSYRICAEGKKVVCSGDVKSHTDYEPLLADGCDALLAETGHFTVEQVCGFARERRDRIGRLIFIHNGRDIIEDVPDALRRAREGFGENVLIAEDGTGTDI